MGFKSQFSFFFLNIISLCRPTNSLEKHRGKFATARQPFDGHESNHPSLGIDSGSSAHTLESGPLFKKKWVNSSNFEDRKIAQYSIT